MEAYLMDWGSMLLRWLHVVTAIAWIGASFFFMHLDASLKPDPSIKAGGATWQVHGGGFYEMRKYFVAPDTLPAEITWHKWQSYWTWISGFILLVWVYYAQATLYLIDPSVMALKPWQASAIGLVSLALGWVVYDQLCKSPLGKNDNLLALAGFGFVVAMSWFYTQVFSGRGALIHTGALMATMMTANVAMIIMPNQRKVIAMLEKGETPDPKYGKQAKQRSAHNNYITLPVLFMMLSNHYPMVWANAAVIPAIVVLIIVAGALIRHFYNIRHTDHAKSPWWTWAAAAIALGIAFYVAMAASPGGRQRLGLAPRETPNVMLAGLRPAPAHVSDIIVSRCSMCHAPEPVWDGIQIAPKGVMLDTPERIALQADAIRMWSVLTHAMPPNNLTEMTGEERRTLADWLKSL
ncbi:MAG TPA: urate hydroxylase PuuD [Beijerinckiaceae bacterium]|nr:urate hydroxylase PuuD [Beijerinckiaceae bacterium]